MWTFRKKLMVIMMFFGVCFSLYIQQVNSQEVGPPITIEPIYPDNQAPTVTGYYRLNVVPNQKQTLIVKVTNNRDKSQKVIIQKANSFTNPVGGMLYRESLDSEDSILLEDAVQLAKYINVESEVNILGNDTVEIPIEISVPNTDSGTVLGAIRFLTKGETNRESVEAEEGKANFVLQTETIHSIAIQLDLPNSVTPSFSIGKAGFTLKGPSAYIEMKNDAQLIQEVVTGEYRVEDSDGNKLYDGEIATFNMAPKTQIRYPFPWNYEVLEDGNYSLFVKVTVNGKELTAEEDFTIGNKEVENYVERNQPVVPRGQTNNVIPIWIWIVAGAIVLAGVMFWLGRRR